MKSIANGPLLGAVVELRQVEMLLSEELGEAIEGCSLLESVALLVSQRENARNACSAVMTERDRLMEQRDKLEAVLRVLLSPDTQIEWSPQVSAACDEGGRLLKEVK